MISADRICERISTVAEFSVEFARSQFKPSTGEFLADPTGQTPLYFVRNGTSWSAVTRKNEISSNAFTQFDEIGLTLQLITGDTNGFVTPYRDVQLVPAGIRAVPGAERLRVVNDDLRSHLITSDHPAGIWGNELLTDPRVTDENSWLFLSGGLDSVCVLLSYFAGGRRLSALHIDRPASPHELSFAHRVAEGRAKLEILPFRPFTAADLLAEPRWSPFGRATNFALYRRALLDAGPRTYCLNGEMNGLDVGFTDNSDRSRAIRRRIYKHDVARSAYLKAGSVRRLIPLKLRKPSKVATLTRSLETATSLLSFSLGAHLGPKGFPGFADVPFLTSGQDFRSMLEERLSTFMPFNESEHFGVDFYLMNYRWILGKSNCAGFQEAAESCGCEAVFPFNSANAILRQVSLPPDLVADKRALKVQFSGSYPDLHDVIWFDKDNTLGNLPEIDHEPNEDWSNKLDDALEVLGAVPTVDRARLRAFVSDRQGAFKGTSATFPTERQLNLISLFTAREDA
jgi:hypothetical protein